MFHKMTSGSEAEFIAEHYWGYSAQPDGGTVEYGVEHPPWNVASADSFGIDCDFAALYGNEFAFLTGQQPASMFLAEGSPVIVRGGKRLP